MPEFPMRFRIHFKAPDMRPQDVEVDEGAARLYWPAPYDDIAVAVANVRPEAVKEVEWL